MKKIVFTLSLPVIFSMGFSPAGGRFNNSEATKFSGTDSSFLRSASQANIAEIEAGKLAGAMAGKETVKKIGNMMVLDHSAAQKELVALAASQNVAIPQEADTEHKEIIAQLSRLSGPAFDSTYLRSQVVDHQVAITLFQQESQDGTNDAVKAYATKYLPRLKNHLSMVKMKNGMASDSRMGM
jgi:putative membrane protein